MTTWHSLLKTTVMIKALVERLGTTGQMEVDPGIESISTEDGAVQYLRILLTVAAKAMSIWCSSILTMESKIEATELTC